MTKHEFIMRLFDNGYGLTLDQIERAEAYAIDDAACQTFDEQEAIELIPTAREVYIEQLHDCENMLEMREYLYKTLYTPQERNGQITDSQVYRLWFAVGRAE